jgi:hypothetical protein
MPLEDIESAGKYVSDLNPLWPLGTDEKRQGDNHIRGIKNVIQNTLVDGSDNPLSRPLYEDYVTQFFARNILLPKFAIIMYNGQFDASTGLVETVYGVWAVCDGRNGTPNLEDRFIRCAVTDADRGVRGGKDSTTEVVNHTHDSGSYSTSSHSHQLRASVSNAAVPSGGGPAYSWVTSSSNDNVTVAGSPIGNSGTLDVFGTSGSTGNGSSIENRPAFHSLLFIMRID